MARSCSELNSSQVRNTYSLNRLGPFLLSLTLACVPAGRDGEQRLGSGLSEPGSVHLDRGDTNSETSSTAPDATVSHDAGVLSGTMEDAGTGANIDAMTQTASADAGIADQGMMSSVDAGFVDNCSSGLSSHNGYCAPDAPEPFRSRTETQICSRWRQDRVGASREWQATPNSTDDCDPGTVSESAYANAILRTNLFRWLAGLSSVTEAVNLREQEQQCAVIQSANGGLNHRPPETANCYSPEGAAGARSSNLASGLSNMAGTVDLYVGDFGVSSLGHRRWVLNPSMEETTFGLKRSSSCMYAFSRSGRNSVDFWSWPPPGHVPHSALLGEWSFASNTYAPNEMTSVEFAIDDEAFQAASSRIVGGNYGWGATIAWRFPSSVGSLRQVDRVVRIRLNNTRGGDFTYTVKFIDCS